MLAAGPPVITGALYGYRANRLAKGIGIGVMVGFFMFILICILVVTQWAGMTGWTGGAMGIQLWIALYGILVFMSIIATVLLTGRPQDRGG